MQDQPQFAKFVTDLCCYVARREREGDSHWKMILSRHIQSDRWVSVADDDFWHPGVAQDFQLLSSSDVEELFYEAL